MSGHPTGYFMTNAIINEFGKEAIILSWTNPFEFFKLYQKAANKNKETYPVFSDSAMNYIHDLEMIYSL